MQLKTFATVLLSSLVFTGCSLIPSSKPEPQEIQETTEVMMDDDVMVKEDSMIEETSHGDKSAVEDDSAMMEAKSLELTAENFTFGVEEITVKQGEKLTVSVMNKQGVHDFVIDELDVNSGIIKEGDTMEITIPTDKPGTYEYYCSVGSHRALGMKGILIIE